MDDEDFVSHAFYRQHIEDGFEKRAPPKLALSKPFYYPIDDAVTRTLAASKYTSKLAEYTLSVSNAFFASTTHAAAQDALAAHLAGDASSTTTMLNQVVNSLAAIKDMQRDRMFFLGPHVRPGLYTDTKGFREQRPQERVHPHCSKQRRIGKNQQEVCSLRVVLPQGYPVRVSQSVCHSPSRVRQQG